MGDNCNYINIKIMPLEHYSGYIERIRPDGWLSSKLSDGKIISLPEYLRIYVEKSKDRETFEIMERAYKGQKASVKIKGVTKDDADGSYFEKTLSGRHISRGKPHTSAAKLIFYRKSKKLKYKDIEISAYTLWINKVPLGTHDLEIPDAPHKGGSGYTKEANYARTWFRIGHEGDRYLHCGQQSAGCITVTDIGEWDMLYKYLILSRKSTISVGTVEVIDQ